MVTPQYLKNPAESGKRQLYMPEDKQYINHKIIDKY